jgi:hypothetical protein
MFFSTTPSAFRQSKPCTLQNGTIIYFGNSNLDCSCLAPIKADPDFAGPGIIASFIFIAWLTIIIAAIPTGYALLKSWQGTTGPNRFWKWLVANLQFEPVEEKGIRTSTLVAALERAPVRDSVATNGSDSRSDLGKVTRFLPTARQQQALRIEKVPEPAYCKWCRRIVLQLCDIQIITGMAILVSALAQYNRLTFYHAQLATQYWWLTLNSFWISRIDYSRNTPEMRTWRASVRRIALWTSVALSVVMQSIVAYREYTQWNITVNGHCYVSNGTGTGFGQNVFWLAGTGIYFFVLTIALFPFSRKWFDENVNAKLVPSIHAMQSWVTESRENTRKYMAESSNLSRPRYYAGVVFQYLRTVSLTVVWITWWLAVLFLSVWCAGNSAAAFELGLYSVFAGFLTWWIVFLKVQNMPLIRGDETRFTMGQTLPLFLLVLVCIHALDVWAGVSYEEQKRKRYRNPEVQPIEDDPDSFDEEDVATNAMTTGMWTSRPLDQVVTASSEVLPPRLPGPGDKEKM